MFTLELAKKEEVKKCYEIILEGMAFQRQQGFTQWTKDYPNKDTISDDVQNEKGYVIKQNGDIAGVRGSRAVYKAFGRNPGRYRVSSEALLRRVRRGDSLYHINSVVDVNNLISIESGLSVGSYDLGHIHGAITFRKAEKGEGYTGIGKGFLDMENMLVLADDEGIFGSTMSDSTRAMVSEESKEILVVIYCFENSIDLQALVDKAKADFQKFANVYDVETWIL